MNYFTKFIALAATLLAFTGNSSAIENGSNTTFELHAFDQEGNELPGLSAFNLRDFYPTGEKTLVETIYKEFNWYGADGKFSIHPYLEHHYKLAGYYRDWYMVGYNSDTTSQLTPSLLVNGIISIGSIGATRLSDPRQLQIDVGIQGDNYDNVAPYIAWAPSHNSAELVEVAIAKEYYPGSDQFGFNSRVTMSFDSESINFQFSIQGSPSAKNDIYSFILYSAAYDQGIHDRFEREDLPPITPVPEPTTWAMLLAGVGIVARRRKTAA